jgi:hypothetical protein
MESHIKQDSTLKMSYVNPLHILENGVWSIIKTRTIEKDCYSKVGQKQKIPASLSLRSPCNIDMVHCSVNLFFVRPKNHSTLEPCKKRIKYCAFQATRTVTTMKLFKTNHSDFIVMLFELCYQIAISLRFSIHSLQASNTIIILIFTIEGEWQKNIWIIFYLSVYRISLMLEKYFLFYLFTAQSDEYKKRV